MAIEYVSELGDKLSNNNTATNLPKHIKVISAPNYQRTDNGVVTNPSLQTALDGKAASTHSHGNITSDGKVGTTANKPLITTTGGAVTTGSFGTSANTFCQGNDSRLSDARTPTAHASTATTYGVGSSTNYGHVKLYDNVTGSNTDGAPTQKSVKEAIAAVEGGKVKATAKSDNINYKLLATASASPTSGALTEAVYDTDITLNPSTNTLTANLSGVATYAKALDPQIILNSTLYKVPVISADKEVRWTGAPGASGSTAELTYDNSNNKNLLSVNVSGYATSIDHAFAGSTVAETPIINVSGSTDGFKLTYGATTADLGITKFYTTDDANAKLSFGNMVSSTYKEALAISNGSANLTGTVNGYTIGKSVPSDAVFTDTTYTANNGVSLSGTTFSNSGVRSATINGDYLRVNTNGTNADLTIPYATNAHRLRAAYAGFNNTTGYRLLAEIKPGTGASANRIATFDALFTHTANSYSLAHIYVNIRTNHSSSGDTYVYYWGYIDKNPTVSRTQIRAYKKTGSNSLFLFAYESDATYCGVQLSISQTSDYNGHYQIMDIVDLKHDDTLVASLDSSYTQLDATNSYHNVLAATSQVGSATVPVYVKSNGELKECALPQTISFSSLGNTTQQRVIARLAYVAGGQNSVMTLMVTQGEEFGAKDSCGIYFVQASYRGTPSLRTTVINSGSSSGPQCTFAYYTGSESGTNYMYIVAKRPKYSASLTVMQIGAFETDGSMASPSKKIYDGGNVSSSGLTDGTVVVCSLSNHTHGNITSSGTITGNGTAISSNSQLVYANSSGTILKSDIKFDGTTTSQALTKKGTFETFAKITWADSIPSDPILGMIYAI